MSIELTTLDSTAKTALRLALGVVAGSTVQAHDAPLVKATGYHAAQVLAVRNVPVVTSGSPIDMGVVDVPPHMTAWRVAAGSATIRYATRVIGETSDGVMSAGKVTLYASPAPDTFYGTRSPEVALPASATKASVTGGTAVSDLTYFTDRPQLFARQTLDAGSTGTVSVYAYVQPIILP